VIVAEEDVPPCSGRHAGTGLGEGDGDGNALGEGLEDGVGEGEGVGEAMALGVGLTCELPGVVEPQAVRRMTSAASAPAFIEVRVAPAGARSQRPKAWFSGDHRPGCMAAPRCGAQPEHDAEQAAATHAFAEDEGDGDR
jgi:hypothetical protein